MGSKVEEQLTQANAAVGTLTFAEIINTIEVYNTDETNTGVFNVNGIDITVPAGKSFKASIGNIPRATVTATGATTYISVTRYV